MPRAGASRRRKTRTQSPSDDSPSCMSMVFKYGALSPTLQQLVRDLRIVLAPNTFSHLRESKRTKLRDYVKAGRELKASTLISVTRTETGNSFLKLARLSEGPTSVFRISEFSLGHDIRVAARRPRSLTDRDLLSPPALVLHGFDEDFGADAPVAELLKAQFEQLVPSLDLAQSQPKLIRRVLLVSLERSSTDRKFVVRLRHFGVSIRNTSVSRAVDKLLKSKGVVNGGKLARLADPADILDAGLVSESEVENEIMGIEGLGGARLRGIPREAGLGVKLVELGPRVELALAEVVEGVFDGRAVYAPLPQAGAQAAAQAGALAAAQPQPQALPSLETQLRTLRGAQAAEARDKKRTRHTSLKAATIQKKITVFHRKTGGAGGSARSQPQPATATATATARVVEFSGPESTKQFKKKRATH